MSFSVSMGNGAYEYAGSSFARLVGHAGNLLNAGHWRLVRDIPRFFKTALARLPHLDDEVTLARFMASEGYSDYFIDRHLLTMAGAIWSSAPGDMRNCPAKAFLKSFDNHRLLRIAGRPLWRTVRGGSREYVSRLMRDGRFETRLRTPVNAIRRGPHGVAIRAADGGAGFHEDGLQAGLAVAEDLGGVGRPWIVENDSGRIHRMTQANSLLRPREAAE